jgi:hypothetical protein
MTHKSKTRFTQRVQKRVSVKVLVNEQWTH